MDGAERESSVAKNKEASEAEPEQKAQNGSSPAEGISIKEKLKDDDYRSKVWRTIWLGASFWVLGFTIGMRGPAFLDIQIITQTTPESASFFFTAGSVGYLAGSLVAGVAYDKLNKSVLLVLSVLGMGAATITLPWCSIYALMIIIHFCVAFCMGSLDTVGNAELMRVWGKEGETAMQSLHFAFAFGGVIGPLATEPFLTPTPAEDYVSSGPVSPNSTLVNSTGVANVTGNSTTTAELPLTTDVHYAYLICGCLIVLSAIPLAVQMFSDRSRKRRQEQTDEKEVVKQPLPTGLFLFVLLTLCLFYFLYCAVEDTFAAYLSMFVVKQLRWSKSNGARIASAFWASFAVGRFLGIFLVRLLSCTKLLLFSGVSLVLSLLLFLLMSHHSVDVGVWVSTILAGASMATIFPTGFTWMEQEFVRVTGRVASSVLIASSSGTMANPVMLGYLMEELSPMWFTYVLLGESLLCFCTFLFLLAFSVYYVQKHYSVREQVKTLEVVATLDQDGNVDVALAADHNKA